MEKFFNGILKGMAVLCAILFILATGIALLLFNAERRLFNADLYLDAFENKNIYDRLPGLIAETLTTLPATDAPDSPRRYFDMFPSKDWESMIRAILPAELTRSTTKQVVTSIFDYLNGKSETASLSLLEFKAHLSGPAGTESLIQVLSVQPDCTIEQIARLTFENLSGQKPSLVFCNPPVEMLALVQPILRVELKGIVTAIPDSVDLISNATSAENPLQELRTARGVMRLSPLLPLGLLFLVTVFAVRDLKGWLDWWGIPMLLGGVFGLIIAATISPLFQWGFAKYLIPRIPTYLPGPLTSTLRELISAVLNGVAAPIIFQSFMLLLGIIMILATRIKRKIKPSEQPQDMGGEVPN